MAVLTCQRCGKAFDLADEIVERYPDWRPGLCFRCKRGKAQTKSPPTGAAADTGKAGQRVSAARSASGFRSSRELLLSPSEVLQRYTEGPDSGVFTDGAAEPNPGPGGWGAVYVLGGAILAEAQGSASHTTNNRMELTALVEGYKLVPQGQAAIVYSDSQLCVNTINLWAADWAKRGWKRKTGEIKNVDLVRELYDLARSRPELELRWIKAHSGFRWNEYADCLATAYRTQR